MGEIQRYESKLCWDEFYGKVARLVKNPKGEAVLYREYVAREQELQEQVQRLQAQLNRIEAQRKKWRESKKEISQNRPQPTALQQRPSIDLRREACSRTLFVTYATAESSAHRCRARGSGHDYHQKQQHFYR